MEAGEPFESVALNYSEALQHKRGRKNYFTPGLAAPEVEKRWKSLKNGAYSEIFERGNMYRIDQRVEFIEPAFIPYQKVKTKIVKRMTNEQRDRNVLFFSQELAQKYNLNVFPDLISGAVEVESSTTVLSIPSVLELTLAQFQELAEREQKRTVQDQLDYLTFLANKTLFIEEAQRRGWTEADVAFTTAYWDTLQLEKEFLFSELEKFLEKNKLTDASMLTYFNSNKDKPEFQTQQIYDLSRLFFPSGYQEGMTRFETQTMSLRARTNAYRAYESIAAGSSFNTVGALFSLDADFAQTGGRIGRIPYDQLDRETQLAVRQMIAGEISEPQRRTASELERGGYAIYYVRDLIPSRLMTFNEAKEVIKIKVKDTFYGQRRTELKQEFEEQYPLSFNDSAVYELVKYLTSLAQRADWQSDISRYTRP